jgi:uncharacterized membrane protein
MSTTISSTAPAPEHASIAAQRGSRIVSLDIFRGLIMVVMALDHTRDYFTNLRFEPEILAQTNSALFFTRWITHFCAPMFFFLAGTGAFLYGRRHTPAELSRFLWTRGLWLVALEFTVVGTGWTFQIPFGFFGVIWALGACMVILAAVVRLPIRWVAVLSIGMIITHNLLDPLRPKQFGSLAWLWNLLHARGSVLLPFDIREFVLFPLIPLIGVMAAGYAFGQLYLMEVARRRRLLTILGTVLIAAFILLRLSNLYGNPPVGQSGVSQGDFHIQPTLEKTIILFFDVEKYPTSLQFLLMTLGPSFLLLAWLDKSNVPKALGPLLTFGRVPMFFYVLHIYLIHTLAVVVALLHHESVRWLFHGAFFGEVPDGYGYNLPSIYLMWMTAIALLCVPCRWFADLKQRRKDWWLSYV